MKEYYEGEIKRLNEELRKAEDHARKVNQSREIRELYESFIEVGFTEDQAWEIFINLVKKPNN